MSKYKIEWNKDADVWEMLRLERHDNIWRTFTYFDDLASAQEYKEKQEANDDKKI